MAQTGNVQTTVRSELSAIRRVRGITASDLAKRVGVSRQTIYAIEAGTYVPNTEVALKLARELEVNVEALFKLDSEGTAALPPVQSEILSAAQVEVGQAMKVCRAGKRLVSVPVSALPYYLPEADGVISRMGRSQSRAEVAVFGDEETSGKRIVLAGCDPAIGLVSRMVEHVSGVEIVAAPASSRLALEWLRDDKVHIAGSHLQDPETREFNVPYLRREFPREDFTIVTFAHWEEGFVTAPGNPKEINKIEDLARKKVRFVNREAGSGSRVLLDRLLGESGIPTQALSGYDTVAYGHLAAAHRVYAQQGDCCLATRSAAQVFGLNFIPLQSERYDFVLRRQTLDMPAVQALMDVLQRAKLRRKLEVLAGYDTARTGAVIA